jgi:hypothetical protein
MPNYNSSSYTSRELAHIGYECACPLHTTGEHCQYLFYPFGFCLNGGIRLETKNESNRSIEQCSCASGYHGTYCEKSIDQCLQNDCSKQGICRNNIDTYECLCFDGFFGFNCERSTVQTVLITVVRRSFGIVAILLITGIVSLVIASDIHTYLTRKRQKSSVLNHIPRVASELLENSVLLLAFTDAPIEMADLSSFGAQSKSMRLKSRINKSSSRHRKRSGYRQISRRKASIKV